MGSLEDLIGVIVVFLGLAFALWATFKCCCPQRSGSDDELESVSVGSENELDLHGYSVPEAESAALFRLQELKGTGEPLVIITGKGLHSVDGRPRIKPAIEELLEQNDIPFGEVRGNSGRLIVYP